jgi:hypothetical protein
LFLCIIGLEVAISGDAQHSHRIGLATDYVHFIGRLMRSNLVTSRYASRDTVPKEWLEEPGYAAETIVRARRELGADLDVAISRVMSDTLVTHYLKDGLASFLNGACPGEGDNPDL